MKCSRLKLILKKLEKIMGKKKKITSICFDYKNFFKDNKKTFDIKKKNIIGRSEAIETIFEKNWEQ